MKITRTVRLNPVLFNIVPLVNVLFLLLFFFTLSKTFVLQPGISVNLPVASFLQVPQQNAQIISVKAEPASTIFFHDQQMTLVGLQRSLSAAHPQGRALIVRADKEASYDLVLAVINYALANGYSVTLATAPAANAANGEPRGNRDSRQP